MNAIRLLLMLMTERWPLGCRPTSQLSNLVAWPGDTSESISTIPTTPQQFHKYPSAFPMPIIVYTNSAPSSSISSTCHQTQAHSANQSSEQNCHASVRHCPPIQ